MPRKYKNIGTTDNQNKIRHTQKTSGIIYHSKKFVTLKIKK